MFGTAVAQNKRTGTRRQRLEESYTGDPLTSIRLWENKKQTNKKMMCGNRDLWLITAVSVI